MFFRGNCLGFFFKHIYKGLAYYFPFLLWIRYAFQPGYKIGGCIDGLDIKSVLMIYLHDLSRFTASHKTMIDIKAMQL